MTVSNTRLGPGRVFVPQTECAGFRAMRPAERHGRQHGSPGTHGTQSIRAHIGAQPGRETLATSTRATRRGASGSRSESRRHRLEVGRGGRSCLTQDAPTVLHRHPQIVTMYLLPPGGKATRQGTAVTPALPAVEPVVMDVHLPAGVAGPDPLSFDVRCFLVPHASGVVLIDTCLPGSHDLIAPALERIRREVARHHRRRVDPFPR